MKPKCLIVDDELDALLVLEAALSPDIECYTAKNLSEARFYLQKQQFDICLADMCLGERENGVELVDLIKSDYPRTAVAGITAHGDIESAVQFLKRGAFDFISKPVDHQQLKTIINNAFNLPTIPKKVDTNFIAKSPKMLELLTQIKRVSQSQAPIHIYGESGSGKEIVAKMIHNLGARANRPFLAVNCGAIPPDLMESEFFGYKKGSFTSANRDHQGFFEQACGGSLFLDEIAELPLHMQVKLLRAIQEKYIRPIGARQEVSVDVRILSATHKNLAELVKHDEFRSDLFYRINVIQLDVPPLRKRKEDIDLFIDRIFSQHSRCNELKISLEARKVLKAYPFLGNVRELENILERTLTLCEGPMVEAKDLKLSPDMSNAMAPANNHSKPLDLGRIDDDLDKLEKKRLVGAMKQANGKKTKAAGLLGLTLNSLRHRLRKHGLDKIGNWESFDSNQVEMIKQAQKSISIKKKAKV